RPPGPVPAALPAWPCAQARPRPRQRAACARAGAEPRQGMSILVREATRSDVPAMSRVLTASIVELCAADHHGDPTIIAGWARNKTPVEVANSFDNPDLTLSLAEYLGEVAAVGGVDRDGGIRLNYVAPEHRFQGVSKALLAAME